MQRLLDRLPLIFFFLLSLIVMSKGQIDLLLCCFAFTGHLEVKSLLALAFGSLKHALPPGRQGYFQ